MHLLKAVVLHKRYDMPGLLCEESPRAIAKGLGTTEENSYS
jgi:hypothetical protein